MTIRSPVSFMFSAVLGGLVACRAVETTGTEWPDLPPTASVVPHTVVTEVTNYYSAITQSQRRVIRTAEEWASFWIEFNGAVEPMPTPPAIDFSQHMVLVAAMGSRPTGGYRIVIESVHRADGKLFARVEAHSPGPTCFVTQALTAPVTAVRVARSDEPVEFLERSSVTEC